MYIINGFSFFKSGGPGTAFYGKAANHWLIGAWRELDILNDVNRRTGLRYTLKAGQTAPTLHDDINTVWNRFTWEVVIVDTRDIEVQDNYYFYGMPMYVLERSANIEQTQGWNNGAFDPVQ